MADANSSAEHPAVPAVDPRGEAGGALLVAAVAGFAFLVTLFVQTPDGPTVGSATAAQVREFAAENGTVIRLAALSGMVAFMSLVVFTAALAQIARARLSMLVLTGLVATGGILIGVLLWLDTAAVSMTVVLPELIDTKLERVDDVTVLAWYGLTGYTHYIADYEMAPIVLILFAFSIAALQGGLLPRWLAWLGLVFACSGTLGIVGIATAVGVLYGFWFGGLFGFILWILLVSVTLALRWWRLHRAQPAVAR